MHPCLRHTMAKNRFALLVLAAVVCIAHDSFYNIINTQERLELPGAVEVSELPTKGLSNSEALQAIHAIQGLQDWVNQFRHYDKARFLPRDDSGPLLLTYVPMNTQLRSRDRTIKPQQSRSFTNVASRSARFRDRLLRERLAHFKAKSEKVRMKTQLELASRKWWRWLEHPSPLTLPMALATGMDQASLGMSPRSLFYQALNSMVMFLSMAKFGKHQNLGSSATGLVALGMSITHAAAIEQVAKELDIELDSVHKIDPDSSNAGPIEYPANKLDYVSELDFPNAQKPLVQGPLKGQGCV